VPVKFVITEIALHPGKTRNLLTRNLQAKPVGTDAAIPQQLEETFGEELEPLDRHLEAVKRSVR
jgi:hypothetical protein